MPSENALPGCLTSFSIQNSKPQARIQNRFSCRPDAFKPKGNSGTTKPNRPTAPDKTMKKLILILCLTAAAATSAAASDEGRIAALEARIADLEHRIAVLERNGNTAYRPNRSVYVCSVTPF